MSKESALKESAMELLTRALDGDSWAEEELIGLIRDQFMRKRIYRYLHKNRTVEDEDIEQEFLIGVARAIPRADLTIGDPIEYIINSGVMNVRQYFRKTMMQSTIQVCNCCGNVSRLNRVNGQYVCKKCGSTDVETKEFTGYDEVAIQNSMARCNVEEEVLSNMIMEQFESTLTPGTNVHNLFKLLNSGVNRDNPDIKNYVAEIAKMWGCSSTNVVLSMRKLATKLKEFADKNDLDELTFIVR